jgi:O-antigen/teichoic acid export membrane protein
VRQLARNVVSTYVTRAVALLALLILFPFVVRHVGLQDYGIWLLVSSFTWLFMSDLGIGTSAARYVAEAAVKDDWDLGSRTLTTGLGCAVGVGLVALAIFGGATAIAWDALNIPSGERGMATLMVGIAGVGYLLLGLPLSLFRSVLAGLQRYDVANGIQVAQSILRTLVTIAVLLAGGGILAVVRSSRAPWRPSACRSSCSASRGW